MNDYGLNYGFAALGSVLGAFVIAFIVIVIAVAIFSIIVNWKMFEKAGKPGWASIIPIYNNIVLFEIIGYKWYYVFLLFVGAIPVIGSFLVLVLQVFIASYSIKLAKAFGKSTGFGIGLWLLNPIFVAIIAFDKKVKYLGPTVNGDIDFNDMF